MSNPSTCECQCDMWCKPGQYLDHKNCICKNKLVGRVIRECTNVINEAMINNKDNITNDDTITYIFIGLFLVLLVIGIVCFCVLAYFKWIIGKKLFKNKFKNKYIYYQNQASNYKMVIESLKIGTKSNYNWDDIVYIHDIDVKLIKLKENRELVLIFIISGTCLILKIKLLIV